jgi:cytochrome c peroxidase
MKKWDRAVLAGACAVVALTLAASSSSAPINSPLGFLDSTGLLQTKATAPSATINTAGPFFTSLGTNGRSCASCHEPSDGFSITPAHLQARFKLSAGTDPVFRPNDGSVCPTADVSTVEARQQAYRLLLQRGLIRVSMPIPANADFYLESVNDPYNCATSSDMSLYRRPLPATNLRFLSAIMWDGREPDLASQANDATTGHAQGPALTEEQAQEIVDFESSLYTAQAIDTNAGSLSSGGASGGPTALSQQSFYLGINDPLGGNPKGVPFNPSAFTVFDAWKNSSDPSRAAVARGQEIFNSRPIAISGVNGLNDKLQMPTIIGTCTTCHDSPNVGDHSVKLPIDVGAGSFDPDGTQLAYLPMYHFRCDNGQEVSTTDPGRAMITGKCADLGKFKGPILRGLAARAPYFHNGRALTLGDAVDFYNQRFSLNLSPQERSDLIAFLEAL